MIILAFAAIYIIWGSTYFFILIAIQSFPPFLLGTIRFIAAGLLLLGWSIIRKEKVFSKNTIKQAAISGFLMLFIGNGAVIWVEQYLPSAVVAIIVSSAPIWFIVLDKPLWAKNFRSKSTIAGLITGFAGVILLFGERILNSDNNDVHIGLSSMIFLVTGSIAWAGGSLYSKYKSPEGAASVNTAWQMIVAGIAFIPGSIIRNEWQMIQWADIPLTAWLAVLYLISMGSIVAFSAYVWLLKVRPATQVSTYAYVNPVVAVLLGVFFADETISLTQILGLVTILGGVLLINLHKYTKRT
ncbi:MAG TPA: EamA family transporter [Sphingobacteriaceae bacterium]|nr:EamA family transporter [Sphingobacteriaceae bacterium]